MLQLHRFCAQLYTILQNAIKTNSVNFIFFRSNLFVSNHLISSFSIFYIRNFNIAITSEFPTIILTIYFSIFFSKQAKNILSYHTLKIGPGICVYLCAFLCVYTLLQRQQFVSEYQKKMVYRSSKKMSYVTPIGAE